MNYYVLTYSPGNEGCPHYLPGDYAPETWEFDIEEPNPFGLSIVNEYSLKITDTEIAALLFDFYEPDPTITSSQFLDVCDKLNVKYRAIPLSVTLPKNRPASKTYAFFLPAEHVALMDLSLSIAETEIDTSTGSPMISSASPPTPIYARIDRFVPKKIGTSDLFFCIELGKLVCTERFRAEAADAYLHGIYFVPIESYRHDPWKYIEGRD